MTIGSESTTATSGPLSGITVVDVCHAAVGPVAAMWLGQLGANVIKIESPDGDSLRNLMPNLGWVSTYYCMANLNKRNLVLDLKDPGDAQVAKDLVATADVFVENRRPGTMDRRGLGWEDMRKVNPRLVYASCSGYGGRGPRRGEGGADAFMRMFTGFDTLNGQQGESWQRFRNRGHVDHIVSSYFATGILAALYQRDITGTGQRVETSMMQATIAYQSTTLSEYFVTGQEPQPRGSAGRWWLPDKAFQASDGYLALTARTDAEWRAICDVLGLPDELGNLDLEQRWADAGRVLAAMDERLQGRSSAYWDEAFAAAGVPCAPFLPMNSVPEDPQVKANEMLVRVQHPWGSVQVSGSPWTFSDATVGPKPAPEKNEYVKEWEGELQERQAHATESTGAWLPAATTSQPLGGVAVVELTGSSLGAMYAAAQLAELGGQVTRLVQPERDLYRAVGPEATDGSGWGAVTAEIDRHKVVELFSPERLARCLGEADVLVTDHTVESLEQAGVDLSGDRLIICRVTEFGERGARAGRVGTELQIQAMTGIWEYLGTLDGEPLRLGMEAGELAAGVAAAQAVVSALIQRAHTLTGQVVTVSALQALISLESHLFAARSEPGLEGGWHLAAPALAESVPLMASDCPLEFSLPDEYAYSELYRTLGVPEELCTNVRYLDKFQLTYNWQEYVEIVGPYFTNWTGEHVKSLVEAFGGICSLGHTYPTLADDPQVRAIGILEAETRPDWQGVQRPIGVRPPWDFNLNYPETETELEARPTSRTAK